MQFVDLTGHKYAKLTVIEEAGRTPTGAVRWLCRCDCGNLTTVCSNNLRRKNPRCATKSCGCLWKFPKGEGAFKALYRQYRDYSAKKRGFVFKLNEDNFRKLVTGNCFYCGLKPNQLTSDNKGTNGLFVYNGIDRVDNTKGYTLKNCVSCCGVCNNMKKVLTQKDFITQVLRIAACVRRSTHKAKPKKRKAYNKTNS